MMRKFLSVLLALVLIVCLLPVNTIQAKAASAMKASEDIIRYLKSMEGFIAIPRWDYVQWTVGYGNRCPAEHLERYLEEGIPIEEADALFLEQLAYFEQQVNTFMDKYGLTYSQNQFDAVLSITYNCGAAWLINDNDLKTAILNGATGNTLIGIMTQRCTAGGEYLPGLMRRRITEADMFLNGRYNTQIPENYCYVFYDAGEGQATAVAQGFDCNLYAVPMVTASREGYTFLGWYTAETGGVKVTYLDENLHQDTLYAHWQEGEGEYTGDTTTIPDGVTVTVTGSVVNVRSGPGVSYSVINSVIAGEKILISQVAAGKDGRLWGKFEKGWLCLEYTTYADIMGEPDDPDIEDTTEETYEVPMYATIVGASTISVYNGPDTSYPKIGSLQENEQVLIVETYQMFSTWWGRLESGGWICLNRYVLMHNDQMLAHSATVTITNSYLNVRSGPGTGYDWLSSLKKGDVVQILAIAEVDSAVWGRFSGGWISLQYTDFDASQLDYYQNHSYGEWYTVTDSTCVTHGLQQRDCLYCDHKETQPAPLSGHSFGQWYTAEEGTCVTPGQERRDCQYCDYFETREADLAGHGFGDWQTVIAPTCTEDGLQRRYCQYCDAYEETVAPATGHSFGQWYETIAPTLTESGEERRDCENCDHYETRVTDPVEHIYGDWYTVTEATCTEDGQQRRDCLDCSHFETRTVPALGHDFSSWQTVTEATCTEDGQQRRECAHCGCAETQVIPAKGHSFGDWHTEQEATCSQEGLAHRDCAVCDYSETRTIEKAEHTFCDWYISIEPTYETPGQERRDCTACGTYETREKEFDGQVTVRWYATITCGALNVRSGPGTDYGIVGSVSYGTVHEVFEQTTVNGKVWARIQQGWICVTGNATLEEVTEVVGHTHSFGDWYTVTEATAEENGLERRDCACGHYETRETVYEPETVTKLYGTLTGHSYLRIRAGAGVGYAVVGQLNYGDRVEIFEIVSVADTQWGRIAQGWICLTGYITLEEVEEPVEHTHTFGDWYTVTEATAEENGLERRDCACGHYETRETTYQAETVTKIYGTLTGYHYLNIRAGLGTGYAVVGQLTYGERVEILEIVTLGAHQWGRLDRGWVQLTGYITLEEVEEPVEHTHTFGDWYTVTEATAEENGLERRDCACGHYETRETTYQAETVTKIYGTLTGYHYLNIRAGLGTGYAVVGQLTYGERVEILEIVTMGTDQWGRIDRGWIQLTGYITLEEVDEPASDTNATVTMTVITAALNVRAGAGTDYSVVASLTYGTEVTVLEQVTVNGKTWVRIEQGWVSMAYLG